MGLGRGEISFTVLTPEEVPEGRVPRWAVLGRSNVGKSTLLNALLHPQKLFRTGQAPGVTRGLVAAQVRLGQSEASTLEIVDLPGFGFAREHSISSDRWGDLADALREKSQERGLLWVWLVDPRRRPDALERQVLEWLGMEPFAWVFTKADQVKKSERSKIEKAWQTWIERASEGPYWVSAMKKEGVQDLLGSARSFLRGHG